MARWVGWLVENDSQRGRWLVGWTTSGVESKPTASGGRWLEW